MRKYKIQPSLVKMLAKIAKKDKVSYEQILKKIEEIITCKDLDHYKNLRKPLQEFKRVHIKGSFVLLFKYNLTEGCITFYDFDHHDRIYTH
jgi:YafQ family addiction module toxin component